MAGPTVHFTLPSWDLLKFPPDPLPPTLPPPVGERTLRAPFGIAPWLFNAAMHPAVPLTFAATYILIVLNVNAYNKSRDYKPWWISRQKLWKAFVVLHNLALAIYSLATFLAMGRAALNTVPFQPTAGLAEVADSLCKLHGPRVLGDAITFNSTINIWETKNQLIKLLPAGTPDPTDVGRIWNEGLAFWGWLFYLSKFYEVIDTLIIVAKGKRSPTLQTYHHAGAMLCMWAGMRYMSPPIWMFVFVNSFIHSVMYVYFALSAMDIRVPKGIKQTLTTMQIAQLLWGSTYAGAHLFISYDIPVATPYQVAAKVAAVASSASSAFVSATSAVSSAVQSPTISAPLGLLIKKLLLRAAGEEGPAERIGIPNHTPVAQAIEHKFEEIKERIVHQPIFETHWRTDYTRINCIDTSGEAFAIWLNLLYLAPLTFLFVRFFIKAYILRAPPKDAKQAVKQIAKDAKTAEAETERTVEEAGRRAEDVVKNGGSEIKKEIKSLYATLKEDIRKINQGKYGSRTVSQRIEDFERQVKEFADKAKEQASQTPRRGSPVKEDPKDVDSPETLSSPDKKKKKKKNKNKGHADESEEKQDANLAATEPTRPGPDDTDAMGKSGISVAPTAEGAPSYAEVADPQK